jgi:hypothetical protein
MFSAPSDQDEGSKLDRTRLRPLDIQKTLCPADESSTISQQLQSSKRSAGPEDDSTDPSAIRLLQGHKTEVRLIPNVVIQLIEFFAGLRLRMESSQNKSFSIRVSEINVMMFLLVIAEI